MLVSIVTNSSWENVSTSCYILYDGKEEGAPDKGNILINSSPNSPWKCVVELIRTGSSNN